MGILQDHGDALARTLRISASDFVKKILASNSVRLTAIRAAGGRGRGYRERRTLRGLACHPIRRAELAIADVPDMATACARATTPLFPAPTHETIGGKGEALTGHVVLPSLLPHGAIDNRPRLNLKTRRPERAERTIHVPVRRDQ